MLGIIIPFRETRNKLSQGADRNKHLKQILDCFQKKLKCNYHVYVIEQYNDSSPFNKGYIMNVGYDICKNNVDYMVFHDVDQLPEYDIYGEIPKKPLHLCTNTDQEDFHFYENMVGGVLLINKSDFELSQGWSNKYIGWGLEDDDMAYRLKNTTGFEHISKDKGKYNSLKHPRVWGLDETYQYYINNKYFREVSNKYGQNFSYNNDTYKDVKYEITNTKNLFNFCTKYTVKIQNPCNYFGYHTMLKPQINPQQKINNYFVNHQNTKCNVLHLKSCLVDKSKIELMKYNPNMIQGLSENKELPIFSKGSFIINENIHNLNNPIGYHNDIMKSLIVSDTDISSFNKELTPTIAIIRKEYVNLYHTIIELFITYITIELTVKKDFNILFLDSHPEGNLDQLWEDILKPKKIVRLDNYSEKIVFNTLIFVPDSYNNPLFNNNIIKSKNNIPNFLTDFIQKVISSYNIPEIKTDKKNLTFIARGDYCPHSRSNGVTCRKVQSIEKTIQLLKVMYPDYNVEYVYFEGIPFKKQLEIVYNTDILAGVHGAALTHVLFMNNNNTLLEFKPKSHINVNMFENLAKYRNIHYKKYLANTVSVINHKLTVSITKNEI